jgi:hypothetical protein
MPAVSDVPEQAPRHDGEPSVAADGSADVAATPAPLTRRSRRGHGHGPERTEQVVPRRSMRVRPLTVLATVAFAALVALTGYASPQFVAVAVALGGFVLAWGWPVLLGLPSPRGTTWVLGLGTVLTCAAVVATTSDPFLQWVPAALAAAVVIAFLHQLLRRDGRPRLAESVSASVTGLAVVAAGAAMAPLPRVLHGDHALAAAMAALALSALCDPLVSMRWSRRWALFIAMLLGAGAAVAVSVPAAHPGMWPAALMGLLVAAVGHAARRIVAVLPAAGTPRAQLAAAAASSLLVGAVVYPFVRYFVA